MKNDPLNEVRNIRRMISAECDDNPETIFAYYLKHQEESKHSGKYRFINTRMESVPATHDTEEFSEPEK